MRQRKPISICLPGEGRVLEARAIGRDAYRIRCGVGPLAEPGDGTHLDPTRPAPTARQVGDALRGSGSTLKIDSRDALGLYGANGARLLVVRADANGILLQSRRTGSCYGGGDSSTRAGGKTGLVKTGRMRASVGNGISVIPFLWHTSGWAVWGLSEDVGATIQPVGRDGKTFQARMAARGADLVALAAPTLADATRRLGELSGCPPVPPLWSLGFLLTRWGYKDWDEIRSVWRRFREGGYPVDAFIYDFECYTRQPDYRLPAVGRPGFADFDWNPQCFPDPARNLAESAALGLETALIRKPRLGNAFLLREAAERGWKIATAPGAHEGRKNKTRKYDARVLDFRRADLRDWYWRRHRHFIEEGVGGWWNDEGEQFPTLYYWWNRAQADGLARDCPGRRHWSINRAFTVGLARLGGTVWTGDSKTSWRDLRMETSKILNYALVGMPWASCDLGGFEGNPSPTLMTRYMQAGVLLPIMRAHSCVNCVPRYPWNFGPRAEAAIRQALNLRYRLLPYLYSLAHEAAETGTPPVRPMAMEFSEPAFADTWRQWMFGPAFLAAPVLEASGRISVRLPRACAWYDFFGGIRVRGGRTVSRRCALEEIPLWQRAGSIAVLAPPLQHSGEMKACELEVRVAAGADAVFRLIEDDGVTDAYRTGRKRTTVWEWNDRSRTLTARVSGAFPGMPRRRRWLVRIVGAGSIGGADVNGKALPRRMIEANDSPGWTLDTQGTAVIRVGAISARSALRLALK